MRTPLRYLLPVLAAGAAAAIAAAPTAAADPDSTNSTDSTASESTSTESTNSTLPQCTTVGGDQDVGTATTECETPGNVQLNATAPDVPAYAYPWDDEFYGPALIIGGGAWGNHGMGGGGGGGHR